LCINAVQLRTKQLNFIYRNGLVTERHDEWDIKTLRLYPETQSRVLQTTVYLSTPLTQVLRKWLSNYTLTGHWWCLRRHLLTPSTACE